MEIAGSAGINAFTAFSIEEFWKAENNADQVVRAALIVGLLHGRGNLVIRLGHHRVQPDSARIVSPGSKGINVGHAGRPAPSEKGGDSAVSVLFPRELR